MITALAAPAARRNDWRVQLQGAYRDAGSLLRALDLAPAEVNLSEAAAAEFALLAPLPYVSRMRRRDPQDPLLRQVLPIAAEESRTPVDLLDPVGDLARTRAPGLIHKYAGRVLLIATGSCAVHCRYCFRRHFPYSEELAARDDWRAALTLIAADNSINEVILSGGDPLSLSTAKLRSLTDRLAGIRHIRRLRLHTRWPVVLPDRVDAELVAWLQSLPWPTTVVIHANHGNEIAADVRDACGRLRVTGATLLNQSVLLAGVNDDAAQLQRLSEALFAAGVLPYYLHLLDRVAGAAHFAVPRERAQGLIAELRAQLPGYLVPRLAQEIAGEPSKTIIA